MNAASAASHFVPTGRRPSPRAVPRPTSPPRRPVPCPAKPDCPQIAWRPGGRGGGGGKSPRAHDYTSPHRHAPSGGSSLTTVSAHWEQHRPERHCGARGPAPFPGPLGAPGADHGQGHVPQAGGMGPKSPPGPWQAQRPDFSRALREPNSALPRSRKSLRRAAPTPSGDRFHAATCPRVPIMARGRNGLTPPASRPCASR
jgi:hypothetical protein